MLDIYGKDEKDELRPAEKKILTALAHDLKREARAAVERWKEMEES
ncbi:MAG: hypothetical protein WD069_12480 [Planctomycetales bacterium]